MDKLNNFEEVKQALKKHSSLTTKGKDVFYLKDGYVIHKFNGNTFKLKYEDFKDLYKDTTFYYPIIEQEIVDLKKDEEYYGRIQKKN